MADLEGLIGGNSTKAERLQRILTDLAAIGIQSNSPFRTEMDDLNPDCPSSGFLCPKVA